MTDVVSARCHRDGATGVQPTCTVPLSIIACGRRGSRRTIRTMAWLAAELVRRNQLVGVVARSISRVASAQRNRTPAKTRLPRGVVLVLCIKVGTSFRTMPATKLSKPRPQDTAIKTRYARDTVGPSFPTGIGFRV